MTKLWIETKKTILLKWKVSHYKSGRKKRSNTSRIDNKKSPYLLEDRGSNNSRDRLVATIAGWIPAIVSDQTVSWQEPFL